MPDYVRDDSKLALFADDSKLYRSLDCVGSTTLLQQDFDGLHRWSVDWHMEYNVTKCNVLHISKKRTPSIKPTYRLGGQPLECVPHTTDLGITISCDLQWARHIEDIASKSNKTLGLIKRICSHIADLDTKKLLYCALVRSRLEYCSSLWSVALHSETSGTNRKCSKTNH